MLKPVIGVVECPYKDKTGNINFLVPGSIVERISKCGGNPIGILPPQLVNYGAELSDVPTLTTSQMNDLNNILSKCDAIIISRAPKIYPFYRYIYGYTYKNDIPYLGIGAGMHIMASHGSHFISQEKNPENGIINHYSKDEYAHRIQISPNTVLRRIIGESSIVVNSRHHYHIPSLYGNLAVAYTADGIIEAIENPNKRYHISLQWHPELMSIKHVASDKFLNSFIEAAEGRDFRKDLKKVKTKGKCNTR